MYSNVHSPILGKSRKNNSSIAVSLSNGERLSFQSTYVLEDTR